MGLFEVCLGIDRAARDTGVRMLMTVMGEDRLSAAIKAEELADRSLSNPVDYTHAMSVTQLRRPIDVALALPVAAVIMVLLRHIHVLYKESDLYEESESSP